MNKVLVAICVVAIAILNGFVDCKENPSLQKFISYTHDLSKIALETPLELEDPKKRQEYAAKIEQLYAAIPDDVKAAHKMGQLDGYIAEVKDLAKPASDGPELRSTWILSYLVGELSNFIDTNFGILM